MHRPPLRGRADRRNRLRWVRGLARATAVLGSTVLTATLLWAGAAAPASAAVHTASTSATAAQASDASSELSVSSRRTNTSSPTPTPGSTATPSVVGPIFTVFADNSGVVAQGQDAAVITTLTAGSTAVAATSISLEMTTETFSSSAALSNWKTAVDRGKPSPAGLRPIGGAGPIAVAAGKTGSSGVSIPAATLALSATTGVYGLLATFSNGSTVIGWASSVIVDQGTSSARASVAIAVPMTVPASSNGLVSADSLSQDTGPGGVLSEELNAILNSPDVTVGIDPMIVASIRALGSSAPASATSWLSQLENAPNDSFALQYADADAAVQVQAGETSPLQPTSLNYALNSANFSSGDYESTPTETPTEGATTPSANPSAPGLLAPSATQAPGAPATGIASATLTAPTTAPTATTPTPSPTAPVTPNSSTLPSLKQLLSFPYTLTGYVWPSAGTVTASDIRDFATSGLTTTILDATNTNQASLATPSDTLLRADNEKTLVSDAGISSALESLADASSVTATASAAATLEAQLALHATSAKSGEVFLATLPRDWAVGAPQASTALQTLSTSPFYSTASFADALASTPTAGLTLKSSGAPAVRVQAAVQLIHSEQQVQGFSAVLTDPTQLTGPARTALLALLSVGSPEDANWQAEVAAQCQSLIDDSNSVQIVSPGSVLQLSNRVNIPITVSNKLNFPVNVVLHATSLSTRLSIDSDVAKQIPADSSLKVLIPVKAQVSNGAATLTMQLYAPSPSTQEIGSPASARVNVHADWEGITAGVFVVLLLLLVGVGIVRTLRRRGRRGGYRGDGGSGEDSGPDSSREAAATTETVQDG